MCVAAGLVALVLLMLWAFNKFARCRAPLPWATSGVDVKVGPEPPSSAVVTSTHGRTDDLGPKPPNSAVVTGTHGCADEPKAKGSYAATPIEYITGTTETAGTED